MLFQCVSHTRLNILGLDESRLRAFPSSTGVRLACTPYGYRTAPPVVCENYTLTMFYGPHGAPRVSTPRGCSQPCRDGTRLEASMCHSRVHDGL